MFIPPMSVTQIAQQSSKPALLICPDALRKHNLITFKLVFAKAMHIVAAHGQAEYPVPQRG
jgi:hypothetical protein